MPYKIHKNFKQSPHTLKEIMEEEQQDLWFQATASVKKLTEVQKRVVELLPEYRKQLPSSFEGLEVLTPNLHWQIISDCARFMPFLKRYGKR